jgi:predicted phosphodiesterase
VVNQQEKIAIISDIHGNSLALQAVLEDIKRQGCSEKFFLGDLINGIDPQTCIKIIRNLDNITCLKGNAEFYVLTPNLEDYPKKDDPFFSELIPLLQWYKYRISEEDLEWLRHLPDYVIRNAACFVHDSPLDRSSLQSKVLSDMDDKYHELELHSKGITVDMPAADWEFLCSWMEAQSLSEVFCGHTHRPFYKRLGEKLICNVGSVGMPLDGDPRPAWMMLERQSGQESIVTLRRVTYKIEKLFRIIDEVDDYPRFKLPADREAYKKLLASGSFPQ